MEMSNDPFSEGLVYEAMLPVGWRVLEEAPSAAVIRGQNERSEDLIRMLSVIGQTGAADYGEEKSDTFQELMRLETKINLVLDLVGELVSRDAGMPERTSVRLSSRGVEWEAGDNPPKPHELLSLNLYLRRNLPRPLELTGKVVAVHNSVVTAVFEGASEAVVDGLDKLIFRHHRRAIAQARTHGGHIDV